jgi:hypothetical protein
MSNFFDAKLFDFVETGSGHKYPVHYRELGEKDGHTYDKKVSWSDVVINNVSLEQTFEFEDGITAIEMSQDNNMDRGVIMVNERQMPVNLVLDDDEVPSQEKKWLNRLDKVCPMTYKEAKKDKKKMNYTAKPKRRAESEKQEKEYDMFHELIEMNDHGPMRLNTFQVWKNKSYASKKTFCPPEHWLTPEIRWDLIWSKMDEIEYGYKRKYHYVKPGEYDYDIAEDSKVRSCGPAIYFYDSDSDDLNMNFDYSSDYIDGYVGIGLKEKVFPFWEREGKMSRGTSTSQVRLERAKDEFVNDPCPSTFSEYQERWCEYEEGQWCALPRYPSSKLSQRSQAPMPHL